MAFFALKAMLIILDICLNAYGILFVYTGGLYNTSICLNAAGLFFPIFRVLRDLYQSDDCLNGAGLFFP